MIEQIIPISYQNNETPNSINLIYPVMYHGRFIGNLLDRDLRTGKAYDITANDSRSHK